MEKFLLIPAEYIVVGEEVCPETGKQHYQGYVEFKNARYFKAVKKIMGDHVHLEPRHGTAAQAADYCKKEGKYHEQGIMSQPQGKRTDISDVYTAVCSGVSLEQIIDANPNNNQALRYAQNILPYKEPKRDWHTVVKWYWGVTGSGKSYTARHEHPDKTMFIQKISDKWWTGYDGHEVVIIDDYRPSFCPFVRLLDLFDEFETIVECKYGMRQFRPKYITVTSIKSPKQWFEDFHEDIQQLLRRIDKVVYFGKKYVPPLVTIEDGLSETSQNNASQEIYDSEADSF